MHNFKQLDPSGIYCIGATNKKQALFENMHPLPDGMSYNAYVILGEKTALLDTTDDSVAGQFRENLSAVLNGRALDYFIISHMEPDHSALVAEICERHPRATVVGTAKTKQLLGQFFGHGYDDRFFVAEDGATLDLGGHALTFYHTPMVHWPEVMMSYEATSKTLFSADAFGTFGGFSANILTNAQFRDYEDEARRYYSNIVGKYGPQVVAATKKLPLENVERLCTLHGPSWEGDLAYILARYANWSTYTPERPGVTIVYGSMYGHTAAAAQTLAAMLDQNGVSDFSLFDVSKTHASYIISEIYKYSHIVLAAPTYNNGVYIPMHNLLADMAALNVQNRKVSLLANGSWAPNAHIGMRNALETMKNIEFVGEPFVIHSAVQPGQRKDLEALARAIADSLK